MGSVLEDLMIEPSRMLLMVWGLLYESRLGSRVAQRGILENLLVCLSNNLIFIVLNQIIINFHEYYSSEFQAVPVCSPPNSRIPNSGTS